MNRIILGTCIILKHSIEGERRFIRS